MDFKGKDHEKKKSGVPKKSYHTLQLLWILRGYPIQKQKKNMFDPPQNAPDSHVGWLATYPQLEESTFAKGESLGKAPCSDVDEDKGLFPKTLAWWLWGSVAGSSSESENHFKNRGAPDTTHNINP